MCTDFPIVIKVVIQLLALVKYINLHSFLHCHVGKLVHVGTWVS